MSSNTEPSPKKTKTTTDWNASSSDFNAGGAMPTFGTTAVESIGDNAVETAMTTAEILTKIDGKFPRILYYKPEQVNQTDPVCASLYPFDPSRVQYSEPKRMDYGGYVVYCTYHLVDEEKNIDAVIPIVLQTPRMRTPWGVSVNTKEDQRKQITVDLSFFGMEKDADVSALYMVLKLWDSLNVAKAKENKTTWFANADDIHPDVLQHFYKPITRLRKRRRDGKAFSPSMTTKVYKRYGVYECEVYDNSSNPKQMTVESIDAGTNLTALVTHTGIWFGHNSFSSAFKLTQACVERTDAVRGFAMVR